MRVERVRHLGPGQEQTGEGCSHGIQKATGCVGEDENRVDFLPK